MLGRGKGARKYNDVVVLTYATPTAGDFGHADIADPVVAKTIYADVQLMSATRTMMTFQQADVVGLEIEFRNPGEVTYNGLRWRGHDVNFAAPERVDNRGRVVRIQGWYQQDNPEIVAPTPPPTPPTPDPEPTPEPEPEE